MLRLRLLIATAVALAVTGCTSGGAEPDRAPSQEQFTFVVLPDTQRYSTSDELAGIMSQQTRWIRDYRDELDTVFVAQVGDLVESHPSEPMWERASTAMKVLDDAGVPSSVLPGNHDMDVRTGEATMFDRYFPPSRYADASWNSPEASYGGFMPGRLNKDSFDLFTAGGMDFLLLNLEYESPDDTLAWAQDVLDRHPDRRVILSTHGFIETNGNRSTFTTRSDPRLNDAPAVWDKLVHDNCNIFLVVGGHWTSRTDPTQGEARRTDANACGRPVHQVLSNYQGRPHGGDGWLRYYAFDPAADTITATTYSPYLERKETDADSAFTLPYAMTSKASGPTSAVVSPGSAWRYRFTSSAPPADWMTSGFDATSWQEGRAPLGFGAYGPRTTIADPRPSKDKPLVVQLVRSVELADAGDLARPTITVQADDGAVVWVNGTEIGRTNLPAGALTSESYATTARSHDDAVAEPVSFRVPKSVLVDGGNTIAVEVHSNYRETRDLTFDLTLTASSRGSGAGR